MRDIATKLFHFTRLCVGIMVITVSCMMNAQNANAQEKAVPAFGGSAKLNHKADVKPSSPYYAAPDFYNMKSGDGLVILPHFKTWQQTTEYTCAPAAALMVEQYVTGKQLSRDDELRIAEGCRTQSFRSEHPGTDMKELVDYYTREGWEVHSTYTDGKVGRRQFPQFVQGKLQNGIPIIVDNIDWGGHYRVIIGYDTMGDDCFENDVLIMADPYDTTDHLQDGYGIEPAARFYYMWFAGDLDANGKRIKQLWMTIGKKQ